VKTSAIGWLITSCLGILYDETIILWPACTQAVLSHLKVLAFLLPVLVHAAVPLSWEMLVGIAHVHNKHGVLNMLTTPDWSLVHEPFCRFAIAGALS
jgi:hypothetical protein